MFLGQAFLESLEARELGKVHFSSVDLIQRHKTKTLWQRDVKGHTGCVNALEFSKDENYLLSGGDDCHVFLWTVSDLMVGEDPKPLKIMNSKHFSNIFSVDFNVNGETGFSAGNDRRFFAHDLETGKNVYRLTGSGSFNRIDAHPTSESVCCAANDSGVVHVVDIRVKEDSEYSIGAGVYSAMYNPLHPELLLISTRSKGVFVRDIRKPNEDYVSFKEWTKKSTFARWSPSGETIAAVISDGSLFCFNMYNDNVVELNDPYYLNSCTMKSCEFIDEDYLLCGSDKWDIYCWEIPKERKVSTKDAAEHSYIPSTTKLEGHRSIVNHIRYSARNNIIASSGVEKIIKCWSPNELPNSYRDPKRREMGDSRDRSASYFDHEIDSVEEDMATLAQFDVYLRQSMGNNRVFVLSDDSDDSDEAMSVREFLMPFGARFNPLDYEDLTGAWDDRNGYANEVMTTDEEDDDDALDMEGPTTEDDEE